MNNRPNLVDDPPWHIVCFVALPFKDTKEFAYKTVLLPALRKVLEQHPYYWQVGRADDWMHAGTIYENVAAWMQRARAYVADISDLNPNVMMELGYMYWARKDNQPLFVLQREGTDQHLSDLSGLIRISYPAITGRHAVEDIADALRDDFGRRTDIQTLNASKRYHYLSPEILEEKCSISPQLAKALAQEAETMEAFRDATSETLWRRLRNSGIDIPQNLVPTCQKTIANLLKGL
jgi:molecular chaperone HtpG